MSSFSFIEQTPWRCAPCDQELEAQEVTVTYLGSSFRVQLMVCPKCGFVLIPEHLATGKMFDVEQLLEDK
ncbi:MAG: DNA-binding protein [Desulfobulbus propionicus]|nr:MAG: DNA-binding protein [Desulfobulbus propionicus]